MWDNQIGSEGAKALLEALKINISLTTLSLIDTDYGSEPVETTKIEKELEINEEIAAANKKLISLKLLLFLGLNPKFETNIPSLIVPIIANYLLSDYMSDEAARKFLHQSESNQQQHTASLTTDESSSSEEQSSKIQRRIH